MAVVHQRWREEFLVQAARADMSIDTARKILRKTKTLHRLAEAQCNGDWPADNGDKDRQVQCAQRGCVVVLVTQDGQEIGVPS